MTQKPVGPDVQAPSDQEQREAANSVADAGTLSLEVGRVFDVPEAWLVRDAIFRAPPNQKISLDFRRTAELHDFALAVLVETLARGQKEVELRGLSSHHQSLLRLLGRPVAEVRRSIDPEL